MSVMMFCIGEMLGIISQDPLFIMMPLLTELHQKCLLPCASLYFRSIQPQQKYPIVLKRSKSPLHRPLPFQSRSQNSLLESTSFDSDLRMSPLWLARALVVFLILIEIRGVDYVSLNWGYNLEIENLHETRGTYRGFCGVCT